MQFAASNANQILGATRCLAEGDPNDLTVGVLRVVSDPNNWLESQMKNYEQLRYFYLSNIACGDIGEADQAAMLAELEKIRVSMQKVEIDQRQLD